MKFKKWKRIWRSWIIKLKVILFLWRLWPTKVNRWRERDDEGQLFLWLKVVRNRLWWTTDREWLTPKILRKIRIDRERKREREKEKEREKEREIKNLVISNKIMFNFQNSTSIFRISPHCFKMSGHFSCSIQRITQFLMVRMILRCIFQQILNNTKFN
jgi:hypothetical protein